MVKGKFGQTAKCLKILWRWLQIGLLVKNICKDNIWSSFMCVLALCHGILHYLLSADLLINLLMLFSIDYVNIYLFSRSFSKDWKAWGYPSLRISWFINFNASCGFQKYQKVFNQKFYLRENFGSNNCLCLLWTCLSKKRKHLWLNNHFL